MLFSGALKDYFEHFERSTTSGGPKMIKNV